MRCQEPYSASGTFCEFSVNLIKKSLTICLWGIVVELIKAVWVHENGEITVDFNFADEYQRIIDYIENNHNIITVIESKAI